MPVNQKIKGALKRGDISKISAILDVAPQTISERLSSEKEIDSVDFINAVCEVTGKRFSYFKKVADYESYKNKVKSESFEDVAHQHYGETLSWELRYEDLEKRYEQLEKEHREQKKLVDSLEAHHHTKDELIKKLNYDIASLKKEIEKLKGS